MRGLYLKVRRVADVIVAGILLILVSPVLAVTAVLIRLRMGSPVLFRQTRVGHRGEFSIIKFRTMVNNAERIGGGYYSPDLNLVPPLGAFLRKMSLDELPQLFNILKGDMAFVGPRPALPSQVSRYSEIQKGRLSVPQGVTGIAQLRYRNNAPWSLRIDSDLEYVATVSPLTDLRILASTPHKVLKGTGVRMDQTAAEVDDLGPVKNTEEKDLP